MISLFTIHDDIVLELPPENTQPTSEEKIKQVCDRLDGKLSLIEQVQELLRRQIFTIDGLNQFGTKEFLAEYQKQSSKKR